MTKTAAQRTIRLLKTGQVFKHGEWTEVPDEYRDKVCQVCPGDEPLTARYDARTPSGRWGYLCNTHFRTLDCSLGIGRGQRLILPSESYEFVD